MSTRLDQMLAERRLLPSRARARDAILRGHVTVNGSHASRPAMPVSDEDVLQVSDPASRFVSRSALKLVAALDHFGLSPADRCALDLGASTGGFSQVLLERGARKVIAVDVGHGQLDRRIAGDPRLVSLEGLNARDLSDTHLGEPIQALVSDVSFISQKLVLPPALARCEPGAFAVVLIKPQFEVGQAFVGKGGIVRSSQAIEAVVDDMVGWFGGLGAWKVKGAIPSPIAGGDGNREFLMAAENLA